MNKKVVFVSGHFNVLHVGHIRLLRFAKECGNKLIVGVESDKISGDAAYINENLRLEGIKSISWIDESFIFNENLVKVLEKIKPDFVVKGKEHEFAINIEELVLNKIGGKLIFSSGETLFSSIEMIRNESLIIEKPIFQIPIDFTNRHNLDKDRMRKLILDIAKLRVCIIGDLIIDEYISCEALGMSQEDPTIVVRPIETFRFLGGAGIVAAHAKGLGSEVNFITITGDDDLVNYTKEKLIEYGIHAHLITDNTRPTTLKQRFRSNGKTLLRVSHLHQNEISIELQNIFYEKVKECTKFCDLLVFSDFNYGCLPDNLVNKIISLCKKKNILLAADSQSSSQNGDISRFKNMDLITPTEREARLSLRNNVDGLIILADKLVSLSNAKNVILKLGSEGLLTYVSSSQRTENIFTDRIKALNNSPRDVSGAGDSLLITAALIMASGGNIWEAASIGSISAAIQVGRVGNTPLNLDELINQIV